MNSPVIGVQLTDGGIFYQAGHYKGTYQYPIVMVKNRPVPICRYYGCKDLQAVISYVRNLLHVDYSVVIEPIIIPEEAVRRFETYSEQTIRWRFSAEFLKQIVKPGVTNVLTRSLNFMHVHNPESLYEYPNYYIGDKHKEALVGTRDTWDELVVKCGSVEQMTVENIYGENYPDAY